MVSKTRKAPRSGKLLLQTFWTGNPLSRLERAALQSWVNVGYTVDIYTYNPISEFKKQLPSTSHIRVHDAREILPQSKLFTYDARAEIGKRDDAFRYLPFSDLFRFTMLQKKGGVWIDLDMFLVKPIPAKLLNRPYIFASERTIQKGAYRKEEPEIPTVSFFKVPGPNSEFMTWIIEHIPSGLLTLKSPFDYMNLYRKAITELKLERYVVPADAFIPLNWWDVKDSFAPGSGLPDHCNKGKYGTEPFCANDLKKPDVYGVHWFRAILRKKNLPYETAAAVRDNLYERMIAQIERDAGFSTNTL